MDIITRGVFGHFIEAERADTHPRLVRLVVGEHVSGVVRIAAVELPPIRLPLRLAQLLPLALSLGVLFVFGSLTKIVDKRTVKMR